jgi:ribosome biogenesis protein SLX9
LQTLSSTGASSKPVTPKKEKRTFKHARLLESTFMFPASRWLNESRSLGIEASRLPYSKSHAKRLKRKAKEELAGGSLSDIQSAIAVVEFNEKTLASETFVKPSKNVNPSKLPAKTPGAGLIGEGKGVPLSQTKRKNALYVPYSNQRILLNPCVRKLERMRHSKVIANSDFKANPFHVIRTHAQNTLVKHTAPAQPSTHV